MVSDRAGGRVVFEGDNIAFLTYDDVTSPRGIHQWTNLSICKNRTPSGFYHVAFAYSRLVDLLDTGDRLELVGIRPWRVINHGPTMSYYYRDPDGNDVELQVDRFATADEATAFMQGEYFRRNPIGIEVDPADLRAKLQAGMPLEDVMRRPDERAE